ncbi:MAG: hypothetical protein ABIY37_06880, partial [Devosia sp.]
MADFDPVGTFSSPQRKPRPYSGFPGVGNDVGSGGLALLIDGARKMKIEGTQWGDVITPWSWFKHSTSQ